MKAAFEEWLNADIDTTDNPYRNNSAAYWAWEGWKAGVKAEREACAKVCDDLRSYPGAEPDVCAAAIRARGQV